MDAESVKLVAQLLQQSWGVYGRWKANSERQDLAQQMASLRAELDAMKLQASIQQLAEIDALGQELDKAGVRAADPADHTKPTQVAHAKAQRLRSLLIADMYNSQIRRLYIASRTKEDIAQDEEQGRKSAGMGHIALMILGLVLGWGVGSLCGAEYEDTHFLGIPTGTTLKTPNYPLGFLLGLVAAALGYATKSLFGNRCASLWSEFGPIPVALMRKGREQIRNKLFK